MTDATNVTFMGGRQTVSDFVSQLKNKTLTIIAPLYEPFAMMTTGEYNISDIQPHEIEGELYRHMLIS